MFTRKLVPLAVAFALGTTMVTGASAVNVRNAAPDIVGAGATADPLVAVEANRTAIVNKLVAEYKEVLAAGGISAGAFRSALAGLRADQLLAASLVSTIEEVTAIVSVGTADGASLQRFIAMSPVELTSAVDVPNAAAYLVREGDSLSIVASSKLRMSSGMTLVGYFAPATVAQAIVAPEMRVAPKDGSGSGPSSWIGFTAGSNVASGTGSAVAAGTFNAATNQNAAVFAGQSNVASGISSLVIGGFDNRATAIDSLVGAGAGHRATGARSVVVGGGYNLASGQWSFIGGGGRQTANAAAAGGFVEDHIASGNFSTIAGGQGNRAGGNYSFVGGGRNNTASGLESVVPGGSNNTASTNGTVAMGRDANATHFGSFVFGDGNGAYGSNGNYTFNVQAQGGVHIAPTTSIQMGSQTRQNITLWGAADQYGIGVQSGTQYFRTNSAFAWFQGGVHDDNTFNPGAGGTRLLTLEQDSSLSFGPGSANGEFLKLNTLNGRSIGSQVFTTYIRTNSTVAFYDGGTHSDSQLDPGSGGAVLASIQVGVGSGTRTGNVRALGFTATSDRESKSDFANVDTRAILAKVAALPVSTWTYKAEEGMGVRHIGPVAQDFALAFQVGYDDKSISTIDASGVALSAIKGLVEEARERDALIAAQAAEIASLKSQMARVAEAQDDLRVVKATLAELLRERAAAPVQVKLINR